MTFSLSESDFIPLIIIFSIIGFSSTLILKIFEVNSNDISLKKFVSYKFFKILFKSLFSIFSLILTLENNFIVSLETLSLPIISILFTISLFAFKIDKKQNKIIKINCLM